jgi:hypothetical protein
MGARLVFIVCFATVFSASQVALGQLLKQSGDRPSPVAEQPQRQADSEVEEASEGPAGVDEGGKVSVQPNASGDSAGDDEQASTIDLAKKESREGVNPMVRGMFEGMFNAMLDLLAEPATAKKLAAFQRNYYEALQEEGFSEEQAFELVTSGNPMGGFASGGQ